MTTTEQEQEARSDLEEVLHGLLEADVAELVRPDLGPFSFDDARPYIERILDLFRELEDCNLEMVPQPKLEQLTERAKAAKEHLHNLIDFDPTEGGDPQPRHQKLINNLKDQWVKSYRQLTPVIAYRSRQAVDLESLERQAEGTVSRVEREAKKFEEKRQEAESQITSALERVREAAAEAGVSREAIHFKQEADRHETASWWWLGAAAAFGLAVLVYVLFFLEPKLVEAAQEGVTSGRLFSFAISRLIVVSILTFGLIWCARNFSQSRHNYVVNRHRRNALSAFRTFVEATGDQHIKDTVLLHATKAVFAPQPTGYSRGDGEPKSSNQLVEIMTRMSEGEGKTTT